MRSNRLNYAVLFVLALLQCFVPLLHAHAHGLSVSQGIHWHEGSALHQLQLQLGKHQPSLLDESEDEPVITAAQELRQDYVLQPEAQSSKQLPQGGDQPALLNSRSHNSISHTIAVWQAVQPSSRMATFSPPRPFSQAPPQEL